jgi:hypothetical protein
LPRRDRAPRVDLQVHRDSHAVRARWYTVKCGAEPRSRILAALL